jgi:hypothetical protein
MAGLPPLSGLIPRSGVVSLAPYALLIACLAAEVFGVASASLEPIKLVACLIIDPRHLTGERP